MAIALRGAGAWTFGINSFSAAIPAAQVTGDMMLFIVTGKGFDVGWSVSTTGWASLGRGQSGTTVAGVDIGSMACEVWYKEATSDTETDPTVTEGVPGWNIVGGAVCVFSKAANETWNTPAAVYGADETTGTALSFTYASDPGGLGGDYVFLGAGINTDSIGPLTTDLVPVWTGITFGTADTGIEGETISGGDMSGHYMSRPVTSGTSSAAPTSTGTGTATGGADRAESVFVRLRVQVQAAASLLYPPSYSYLRVR